MDIIGLKKGDPLQTPKIRLSPEILNLIAELDEFKDFGTEGFSELGHIGCG